jgi:hypothetical protein
VRVFQTMSVGAEPMMPVVMGTPVEFGDGLKVLAQILTP